MTSGAVLANNTINFIVCLVYIAAGFCYDYPMRTIHRDIVGAFIFSKDNKILLGQSRKGGVYQNQWIVPGGGIEDGEEKVDAVRREVLEEVGIDISGVALKPVADVSQGESEKTLRDTQEKVLVKMSFYDYVIFLEENAKDIQLTFEDDLSKADWFSVAELQNITMSPATKATLEKLDFTG